MELKRTSIILITIIISSKAITQYTIKELESNTGTYVEDIGNLQIYNNYWNLITSLDLSTNSANNNHLKNEISKAQEICKILENHSLTKHCPEIINELNKIKLNIEADEQIITGLFQNSQLRRKRSYFDGVGKLSKWMFGTLDSDDAKLYDEQISQLKIKSQKTINVVEKQTSLFRSTIDLLHNSIESHNQNIVNISKNFDKVRIHIYNITSLLENQTSNLRTIENFSENLLSLQLFTQQLSSDQKRILEILLYATQNKLHPYLINPIHLKEKLEIISQHLPKYLTIPSEKNEPDLNTIYQLSSFKTHLINKKLVFEIKIPLTQVEIFKIHKLTTLPIKYINQFLFFQIDHNILAISENNYNYIVTDQTELNNCHVKENTYFCNQKFDLYVTHSYKTCELVAFENDNEIFNICQRKPINFTNDLWINLNSKNTWLFIIKNTLKTKIKCNNTTETINLSGKGTISISTKCSIYTGQLILHARTENKLIIEEMDMNKFIFHKIEQINISNDKTLNNIALYDMKLINSGSKVKELNSNLNQIENTIQQIKNIKVESKHNLVQYICIISIMLTITIYSVVKYCKKSKPKIDQKNENVPEPETETNTSIPRFNVN